METSQQTFLRGYIKSILKEDYKTLLVVDQLTGTFYNVSVREPASNLKVGSLVEVTGTLSKNVTADGDIFLMLSADKVYDMSH